MLGTIEKGKMKGKKQVGIKINKREMLRTVTGTTTTGGQKG